MKHEDLLGYLLGALEPDEMQRVAQWLRDDPAARDQLAEIERSLRPLQPNESETHPLEEEPPTDLVARTLASLPPMPLSSIEAGLSPTVEPVTLSGMNQGLEPPSKPVSSWFDWAGGAVSVAILLGLLLPMLANGRLESRKIACQDHLRQLGTALTQFVSRSQQERLPAISRRGPEAFAGVYAVRLKEVGLLDDPSIRWCPSRDFPDSDAVTTSDINDLVDTASLHRVTVDQLRRIQRFSGGHYAYSLGVIDTNGYTSPRYESRSTFAVMSDAPLRQVIGQTADDTVFGHSGRGINVLYEDGRVTFVNVSSLDSMIDHPLRNHLGQGEAGVNVDDASLAPSWRPPFVNVRQR